MAVIKEINETPQTIEVKVNIGNKKYVLNVGSEQELVEDLASISSCKKEIIGSIIRAYKRYSYVIWESKQKEV